MPALSLRMRLTALWSLVSVFVSIGLEGLALTVLTAQLNGTVDRNLALEVRDYQRAAAGARDLADLRSRATSFLARESAPGRAGAAGWFRIRLDDGTLLTNSDDRGLLATMAAARPAPGRAVTVHDPRHGDLRMAAISIQRDGRQVGELRIALPLGAVQTTVGDLIVPLSVANVLLIGVAGLVAYVVIGRTLAPVRRITATAAGIGEADLGRRIGHRGPRDEVGTLAATFDEMLDRLQRELEQRQAFYALASHELRTPLTIVRGHLEVLRRSQAPAAEDVHEALDVALEELDRVTAEVNDMLLLGRMLLGQPGPMDGIDAASLVAEVHQRARGQAARDWHLDARAPVPVRADREQLGRALLNLVTNAVRHTGEGDSVRLACRPSGPWARVDVADSGHGIAPADLPHVFDPWYRVGRGDGHVGGLGLVIVREVARAHGGRVEVESREGSGTTFTVWLPLDDAGAKPPR